ncbi:hypothetical protein AB1L42_06910 [Thalassoglobus sp. JC818]|uniref:hypothetical protein n=1 Tax=Thalassoglobus sp. JC818 TaxID=3232136 RepID=UPI00345AE14A
MMRSVLFIRSAFLFACLTLTMLTGCVYGPNPYYGGYSPSPYGGAYPGGQYQGGYPGYQPGMTVPNGTVSPGLVVPQGGSTYEGSGGLQPIPNNGTDAPPYNSGSNDQVPVPGQYNSSGTNFYPNSSGSSTYEFQDSQSPISPANHSQVDQMQPVQMPLRESNAAFGNTDFPPYNPAPEVSRSSSNSAPVHVDPMSNAVEINSFPADAPQFIPPVQASPQRGAILNDPFAQPAPSQSGGGSAPQALPLEFNAQKVPDGELGVFDHEQKFRWIRGVASLDKPTGIWGVTYSESPDQGDPFSGHLSLAKSPALENLQEGEIVQVSGEVDPVMKDPLGKPMYFVTSIDRVELNH